MKYSANFYPEKRTNVVENVPILLSVTYSRKRIFYYTGKRCDITQWDAEKNELKRNQISINDQNSRDFNADLSKIKLAVNNLFKGYDLENKVPTTVQLKKDLALMLGKNGKGQENFFNRFDKYITDGNLSKSSNAHLKGVLKKLKKFRQVDTFENFDVEYLTEFHNYMLNDCNLSKNSICAELNLIKTFFKYAINNNWTKSNPFVNFKIDPEAYGNPVYITLEERDQIYNAVINDKLLDLVRDIFVFQCSVGCRVGDLFNMKRENVINGCIEYIAAKTKDHKPRVARIPLTKKALSIIEKYNSENDKLLPSIKLRTYNKSIKKLFTTLEIKRLVTIPDKKTRNSIQVPICSIASSHMARRVFIGGLYKKGVRSEIIASMSGHIKNSKAFSRYYDIDTEDQKLAVDLIE
jgi:site-specific recombinase XerD